MFESLITRQLQHYRKTTGDYRSVFSTEDRRRIRLANDRFHPRRRTIVFVVFENQYASVGGLGTIARHLPEHIARGNERVIVITPLHRNHPAVKAALAAQVFRTCFVNRSFACANFTTTLSCYQDTTATVPSYYVEMPAQFVNADNPYEFETPGGLVCDSLALCAATPFALASLGITRDIVFHAHDWETAAVALTSKIALVSGLLENAVSILTLHNSYDAPLPVNACNRFFGAPAAGATVLQASIPYLDGPITTVSTPFAVELQFDPLQTRHFAPHLQQFFAVNKPIGVENGMFGKLHLPYSLQAVEAARSGSIQHLHYEKMAYKQAFVEAATAYKDARIRGLLEFCGTLTEPLFFMTGRLDIMQKGFDVIFEAFRRLPRASCKLFFCPSSAGSGENAVLDYFNDIAQECRGDITIWPFRLSADQYNMYLQGSDYLLMPSLYEPFGAATEGYIHGTPVVARATGGLISQINPVNKKDIQLPEFYRDMINHVWKEDKPTGFLYRETISGGNTGTSWRELIGTPVQKRMDSALFQSMVAAATETLIEACACRKLPERFCQLMLNGFECVQTLTWQKAVDKYRSIYDSALVSHT
ncbi:MAG: glycosyltransferase [Chitinivibrionales bacterium]|nr:glycosyltransferase [Chitinivibrionales bacterium]